MLQWGAEGGMGTAHPARVTKSKENIREMVSGAICYVLKGARPQALLGCQGEGLVSMGHACLHALWWVSMIAAPFWTHLEQISWSMYLGNTAILRSPSG